MGCIKDVNVAGFGCLFCVWCAVFLVGKIQTKYEESFATYKDVQDVDKDCGILIQSVEDDKKKENLKETEKQKEKEQNKEPDEQESPNTNENEANGKVKKTESQSDINMSN